MNSIGIVTFLNPIIGHHNGDLVGKECARTGKNVREVVLEMGLLNEFEQMQGMMKKMKGGGMMKMMKRMGGMKGMPKMPF